MELLEILKYLRSYESWGEAFVALLAERFVYVDHEASAKHYVPFPVSYGTVIFCYQDISAPWVI